MRYMAISSDDLRGVLGAWLRLAGSFSASFAAGIVLWFGMAQANDPSHPQPTTALALPTPIAPSA